MNQKIAFEKVFVGESNSGLQLQEQQALYRYATATVQKGFFNCILIRMIARARLIYLVKNVTEQAPTRPRALG